MAVAIFIGGFVVGTTFGLLLAGFVYRSAK
jgi:hypothetical protein